ncbi:tyrosine-type recombinase/integrase [Flavobacterium gawalongense]|uniref:Tyrosine-type recombinase/integrase n=1 Tax=Flavobacterium gawalongense TaxID=2594432 RepID=A0A553BN05_9FLAO|nr:tyrosine-type recombinase/integrase [Flavobacterium gawalongense]TRW95415.1 tyrosine-type recombinase/integrase [Flavobacterium gawalongense]TRX00300.1 tyrosine-type recombinase/integrase [Flavobacterium gawalongense]TRX09640.1 tyrosine-type recombinase/integrase [Flavobacterium gawalongense]TRX09648.1 tyrosine-type recombinase/integrase [Flavobacterium gawalongense]TRX10866.1 tyrosine-type recombinase/integrase [Flavobacterium gawalongense]
MNLQEYLEQNLQKSTAKNYLYEINKFTLLNRNTEHYNYKNVMEYVEIIRKNYEPASIIRILSALKKYYDYLVNTGIRKDNPARAIQLRDIKKKPIQLQDLFTDNELQKLLEPRKERYQLLAKRNQIIMGLLVNQALKIGEIIQIKTTDIFLEKAQINITGTTQTNNRILPLKAEQILLFYNYLENRNHTSNVFLLNKLNSPITGEDINYLISTYQNQFAKKLTSITIRQSVITNLLTKGNDLRMVQEFAGHKYLDTTEKYKQTGIKALQNAIEKHHPIQ